MEKPIDKLEYVFSVSEFNEVVNRHLSLLGEVVVEGEISQLRINQGKWVFATIKDSGASVDVFGVAYQLTNLRSLEEGMKVKVYGTAGVHTKSGRFSLRAVQIVPSGAGALAAAYEKLKLTLTTEGLFAEERKRELPSFPERIGLITAKGSEAYNDFVKVLAERMGGMKIKFYPVQVQGREAVGSVVEALGYFNNKQDVDVVVVTRGGGSLEDLAAFNDEAVVRAVFGSKLPVVCAIGHEGDVSLAELAADQRASTPTNAAMMVCRDRKEVGAEVKTDETTMEQMIRRRIEANNYRVDQTVGRIEVEIGQAMNQLTGVVTGFEQQMGGVVRRLEMMSSDMSQMIVNLSTKMEVRLTDRQTQVEGLERLLKSLDYKQVLKRGYSITFDSLGKPVSDMAKVKMGDELVTQLSAGKIGSRVTKLINNDLGNN